MPPSSDNGNTQLLYTIHNNQAKQEQMLSGVVGDIAEIKESQEKMRENYMQVREANMRFDSLMSLVTTMQNQINDLMQWRLAEIQKRGDGVLMTNDKIAGAEDKWQAKISGAQAAIIAFILSVVVPLLIWYLTRGH